MGSIWSSGWHMTIVTDLELYYDDSFESLFYYFVIAVVIIHLHLSRFGPLLAPP